ncbi:hypothetical protein ACWC2T_38060 [Streptomyces sp. NPDC001393]
MRALLDLDDDTAVLIRQLACTEPGCPPLETVVVVLPMEGDARRWTCTAPPTRSPRTTCGPPCSPLNSTTRRPI